MTKRSKYVIFHFSKTKEKKQIKDSQKSNLAALQAVFKTCVITLNFQASVLSRDRK